jgi:uncharacterized FlaG/YvyC family protein
MDVQGISQLQDQPRAETGAERNAALAEARRRATIDRIQSAEASAARRADKIAEYRNVVADAVGADTRVAISRAPAAPVFVYQAIDAETGEVVQEWPRLESLALAEALRAAAADTQGRAVDRTA